MKCGSGYTQLLTSRVRLSSASGLSSSGASPAITPSLVTPKRTTARAVREGGDGLHHLPAPGSLCSGRRSLNSVALFSPPATSASSRFSAGDILDAGTLGPCWPAQRPAVEKLVARRRTTDANSGNRSKREGDRRRRGATSSLIGPASAGSSSSAPARPSPSTRTLTSAASTRIEARRPRRSCWRSRTRAYCSGSRCRAPQKLGTRHVWAIEYGALAETSSETPELLG